MEPSTVYILIAKLGLAAMAVLVFVAGRRAGERRLPLAGLAIGFILAAMPQHGGPP